MDLATRLAELAGDQEERGNYQQAERLLRLAISVREVTLGSSYPGQATDLYDLGVLCSVQNKNMEADSLLMRALSLRPENEIAGNEELSAPVAVHEAMNK